MGFNGIPSGEFTAVRSDRIPIQPLDSPLDEEGQGASSGLFAARKLVSIQQLKKRNKNTFKEKGDLTCLHVGKPGQVSSSTSRRVLYQSMEIPALLLPMVL